MEVTKGSSIPVPCVQEVARESPKLLPKRYVRLDQEPPLISNPVSPQIPVIDMDRLLSNDHVLRSAELEKLHHASKHWGFFQLINHGVSASSVERVKLQIQELFNLPMEEKKKLWQQPGDLEGFGQAFVVSEEQKLDWGDMFFITTLPTHSRKPHLFPNLPPQFRDTVEAYSEELKNLAMKILYLQAEALNMEAKDIRELFEEGWQSMRMNFYPPCPQPELAVGLSPHSDAVGLTILLQINEMEGLHIRKDGAWVPVEPLPHAFVINIGDIMEIVSNGIYRSVEHRAAVNAVKERLSIATFYTPKLEGELGPAPSLVTAETPAKFRRIGVVEYFKQFFTRKLEGKSYLEVMRIEKEESKSM